MEAMNGHVRPLNPDEQAWLNNILGRQPAVQAPEMIEDALQIAPAAENVLTPFSVINILQQIGQQLNVLAEQSDKEDSEFAVGREIIGNLQISAIQLSERAHFAEKNVITTLEANHQLSERLAEQGQQMFATLQQLSATQEAHHHLVSKVAQNEARSMSKQIEKRIDLLQSLVHNYLNHPLRQENPSVIADEELQNILQLTQQLHIAIQEMQPHIEDQHLNPENTNYLKGVIERSRQQLLVVEEKINEVAALVSLDTKHDARDLVDTALIAHDALRERKAAILLLAEQRHEPCLLSVQELQVIDRFLTDMEAAAEKLAPAFEENALSLQVTEKLWSDQENLQRLLEQAAQKTQQLQNQLSYAVKSEARSTVTLIDRKLSSTRELMERLRRPLVQNGNPLATPEELAAIQQNHENLEGLKERLLPALTPALLLKEETDTLAPIILEAEAELQAIETSIVNLKNKVSDDVKHAAQAILAYAPQRVEMVSARENTYREILARTDEAAYEDQEPTLEVLKQSIEAKIARMTQLVADAEFTPEKEVELTALITEFRGILTELEAKNTHLAALSLHSLAQENRKLILELNPKRVKMQRLFSQHLAHAQRLLRAPAISEERQAVINALKAKLQRNLQGKHGIPDQELPVDVVAKSNFINRDTKQNIEAAIIELAYLEGIISNHARDVKETAAEVIALAETKKTKLDAIIEKHEKFKTMTDPESDYRLNTETTEAIKNCRDQLIARILEMRSLRYPTARNRVLTEVEVERLRVLIVEVREKIASAIRFFPLMRDVFNHIKQRAEDFKQEILTRIRDEPSNPRVPDSTYTEAPDAAFTLNAIYRTISRTCCENNLAWMNILPVVGSVAYIGVELTIVSRKNGTAKDYQDSFVKYVNAGREIPLLLESIAND